MIDWIHSFLWRLGFADEAIYWNPYNKVVQSHRDGTILVHATNWDRARRNLPVPWSPALGDKEIRGIV